MISVTKIIFSLGKRILSVVEMIFSVTDRIAYLIQRMLSTVKMILSVIQRIDPATQIIYFIPRINALSFSTSSGSLISAESNLLSTTLIR